jgi:hypothetical protein
MGAAPVLTTGRGGAVKKIAVEDVQSGRDGSDATGGGASVAGAAT